MCSELENLRSAWLETRHLTERLCRPMQVEDFCIQSMPDVSPPKWHLAHTTWFFEEFLLGQTSDYRPVHPRYRFLFNSYYESVGEHLERSKRGVLSRPTTDEVMQYRSEIDERVQSMFEPLTDCRQQRETLRLGIHHEQQHQELLLTDLKHIFWSNPLRPVYYDRETERSVPPHANPYGYEDEWVEIEEGLYEIGHDPEDGFSFDNETPKHPVYAAEFSIQRRLITNGEYLEFIEAGGYRDPALWLSQGWDLAKHWEAPLYWEKSPTGWTEMTLAGMLPLDLNAPVAHVSFFEADAFARWRGARLPTEAEWEIYALTRPIEGNFLEGGRYHPAALKKSTPSDQLWGEVWQWTASAYRPYPGFKPLSGSFGEYNAKFMSNQMVLRGGSCVTPRSHIRATYRNFFQPEARWQFSGIRLAR